MDRLLTSTTLNPVNALLIVFVPIFILQLLLFLITWFPDWPGRVSRVELHALVHFIEIQKKVLPHSGLGRGARQLFR